jgi:hypothetical protein
MTTQTAEKPLATTAVDEHPSMVLAIVPVVVFLFGFQLALGFALTAAMPWAVVFEMLALLALLVALGWGSEAVSRARRHRKRAG